MEVRSKVAPNPLLVEANPWGAGNNDYHQHEGTDMLEMIEALDLAFQYEEWGARYDAADAAGSPQDLIRHKPRRRRNT